ncbi:hypothetical protein MBH78_22500 [Oceanimonas sp. NS1]|nr:hypothetical protein [Oceanimonas sp. NS1]
MNTEGYSRQRAEQATTMHMFSGGNFYGTGTRVNDVTRMYQEYAFRDVLINSTEKAGAEALYNHLDYLDKTMTSVNAGLASSLDDLYGAINAVADNPGNLGNRELMLANAQDIVDHFNDFYSSVEQERMIKNRDIESRAEHISSLTAGIADLNQQILNAGQNAPPNDLLDQRDRLIQELGQQVHITTLKESNGMVSVMLGGREPLVSGNQAYLPTGGAAGLAGSATDRALPASTQQQWPGYPAQGAARLWAVKWAPCFIIAIRCWAPT